MTKDQKKIIELLSGRTVQDQRDLPQQVYLEEGGAEELEARRALARELRTSIPLNLGLRFLLANLIDPDCGDEVERRIRFEHRREGQPSSDARAEKKIAEFIWSRVQGGAQMKAAIPDATRKFKLGRTRIREIWRHWEPILKRAKRTRPLKLSDWE
jgi:hypothetical protein